MRSARIAVYRRALEAFGVENQISMVHEEIGELLAAIGKFRRGRITEAHVVSEIADVRIMLEQLEEVLGVDPGRVEDEIDEKVRRLRTRLPPAPVREPRPWRTRIACDFDGVIHACEGPHQGSTIVPDAPVPGALDFIRRAHLKGIEILIHTARLAWDPSAYFHEETTIEERVEAIRKWFLEHGLEEVVLDESVRFHTGPGKPYAEIYLDDRAVEFRGHFPDLETLADFEPWNKIERFVPPELREVQ